MSELFGKLISKLLAVVIIILFVIGFREMILTDSDAATAFGAIMGTLPFAKLIVDTLSRIMKFQNSIPIITSASLISDFLRLAVMACIQPLIVGIFSLLFLRVPAGSVDERETYMKGAGYKVKELLITVITAPFIALAASWLTAYISDYLTANFGIIVSGILGIAVVLVFSLISIIPLLIGGVALGTAVMWRLLVTLLSKMASTFVTNAICLWIYIVFTGGIEEQKLISVLSLIIWLIVMDFALQCLKKVIVSS